MANYQSVYTGAEHDAYVTKASLVNLMFPVGAVYITMGNTNPGTFLGGTWEQFSQGRVLMGVGTGTDDNSTSQTFTENDRSGEYTHTLTENEMPSHRHKFHSNWADRGYNIPDGYRIWGALITLSGDSNGVLTGYNAYPGNNTGYMSMLSTGGGETHNNVQPYQTVYFWKRIA